jgi:hypothetical protein
VLLSLMARERVPLTAAQIRDRCTDTWVPPLVDDWLREAFDRGLVNVRKHADLPSEWILTPTGSKRAARARSGSS